MISVAAQTSPVLAAVAPRLALAHAERRAEIRRDDLLLLKMAGERVELERLVAHRELQLVRAGRTRSDWYIAERMRKLDRARAELAAVNVVLKQIRELNP